MTKKDLKMKRTIIFNNPSVANYLQKKSELLSQKYHQKISVNQLINYILEEYVSRECLPTYEQLENMHSELDLQNKKIEVLTESLHELIQVLTID